MPNELQAAEILASGHPLHQPFRAWQRKRAGNGPVAEPTKRQARKFLQAHPHYHQIKKAA